MILTSQARLGFDFYRHGKNGNTIIFGGPGTWKSRGYIIPNIMQMNCNFVVTDPKGELAKKCGDMLKRMGYRVIVFDVSKPENLHVTIHLYISEMTLECSVLSITFSASQEQKNHPENGSVLG